MKFKVGDRVMQTSDELSPGNRYSYSKKGDEGKITEIFAAYPKSDSYALVIFGRSTHITGIYLKHLKKTDTSLNQFVLDNNYE